MDESELTNALHSIAAEAPSASGEERVVARATSRLRRNVALSAVASVVVVAASITGVRSVGRSSPPILRPAPSSSTTPASGSPKSVSLRVGELECTASIKSDAVRPGYPTGLVFTLRNVGNTSTETRGFTEGNVRVLDRRGAVLWDTYSSLPPHSRPAPLPITIEPDKQTSITTVDTVVRWTGPLRLVPLCGGLHGDAQEMPPIDVNVTVPATVLGRADALDRVLRRTGGIFDACRPAPDGSWTTGSIAPPDGSMSFSPLGARCRARMEERGGFWDVTLFMVSPPDAPSVSFPEAGFPRLPTNLPMSVMQWEFVASADTAAQALAISNSQTRAGPGTSVTFSFEDGRWTQSSSGICGAQSDGTGPFIEWYSRCKG
jgi:hypothetical protein